MLNGNLGSKEGRFPFGLAVGAPAWLLQPLSQAGGEFLHISAGGRRQNVLAVGRRLSGRVIFLQRLGYDQVSVLPSVHFGADFVSRRSVNQYVESHR